MAAVEDELPTSSTSTFSKEEVNKLMNQGRRHFVCDEVVEAVKCFETACLMLNTEYGALSNECVDAHFQYGKSLLELARLESGVLGSALKEVVEDEVDEDVSGDSDGETNMDTGDGTSAGGSADACTKQVVESTAEDNGVGKSAAAGESTAETMSEDKTETKTEAKQDDKQEEKAVTNEEKPAGDKSGGSTEDNHKKDKRELDKKIISEDTSKSSKESTSEERKEVDEAVAAEQKEGQKMEKTEEKEDKNKSENEKKTDDSKDKNEEDANDDEEESKEDGPISTLQLAWETLELARIVFKRHTNTEMQLKLAQTHLLLGEIHMEQEQFTDAVSELTKCLNIQKNLLKPDDRLLAETYYNLGLAYTLSMLYEESAGHYRNAAEVLELRVKNIKTRIEEAEQQDKGKDKASDDDTLVKDRKELSELEELLPEIREKCIDAKNEMERLKSNIREQLGLTSVGAGNNSSSTCGTSGETTKPATDISHLVRKKRKPKDDEEGAESSEAPTKKARQYEEITSQNGHSQ